MTKLDERYIRKVWRDDSHPERYAAYFGDPSPSTRSASLVSSTQNGQTVSTRSAAQTFHNTLSDLVNKVSIKCGEEVIRELLLNRIAGELSMQYGTDYGEALRMLVPIVKGTDEKNDQLLTKAARILMR